MAKISDHLPPHKKDRKQKILAKQAKTDAKNAKARAKALAKEQAEREAAIEARKPKPDTETTATPVQDLGVDFASDEAGELAVAMLNAEKISVEEIQGIEGTSKSGAITVGDLRKAAQE